MIHMLSCKGPVVFRGVLGFPNVWLSDWDAPLIFRWMVLNKVKSKKSLLFICPSWGPSKCPRKANLSYILKKGIETTYCYKLQCIKNWKNVLFGGGFLGNGIFEYEQNGFCCYIRTVESYCPHGAGLDLMSK